MKNYSNEIIIQKLKEVFKNNKLDCNILENKLDEIIFEIESLERLPIYFSKLQNLFNTEEILLIAEPTTDETVIYTFSVIPSKKDLK